MSWIICLVLVFLSISLIVRLPFFDVIGVAKKYMILAYIVKLVAAVAFIWLYTSYYTNRSEADVYKYFDDGLILYEVSNTSISDFIILSTGIGGNMEDLTAKYLSNTHFWDKSPALPFLNDNRLIIRFNALMNVISQGNIFVHVIVAIFISFIGLIMLMKFFSKSFPIHPLIIFLILFVTPSLVFWTSSVLKESFLVLGLGGYLWNMEKLKKFSWLSFFALLIFAVLILQSKVYVLAILIPLSIAFLWENEKNDGKSMLRYSSVLLFFISLALSLTWLIDYNILGALAFKQSEFKCLAEWMGAGSMVYLPDIDDSLISFIKAAPFAIYNALFRPMPWDVNSIVSFMAMLETVAIFLLFIASIIFHKKIDSAHRNIFLFSIFFILSLALLIGLTTPVLGAIVRYRIILLPFFILLFLMMLDIKKLSKFARLKPDS